MTGGWVESYPDDVKAIYEAGHDLGNHSQNHKNMSQLSDEEKTQELMSVHEKVKELTGVKMQLFRPPYGDYDDAVVLNAGKMDIIRFSGTWIVWIGKTTGLIVF